MKIEYSYAENGDIVLPSHEPPFDGNPVLIKTNTGWVEAWWAGWEPPQDHFLPDSDGTGFEWVCYDDKFVEELDNATDWLPLPQEEELKRGEIR